MLTESPNVPRGEPRHQLGIRFAQLLPCLQLESYGLANRVDSSRSHRDAERQAHHPDREWRRTESTARRRRILPDGPTSPSTPTKPRTTERAAKLRWLARSTVRGTMPDVVESSVALSPPGPVSAVAAPP